MTIAAQIAQIAADYDGDYLEIPCEGLTFDGRRVSLDVIADDSDDPSIACYVGTVWVRMGVSPWSVPLLAGIKQA